MQQLHYSFDAWREHSDSLVRIASESMNPSIVIPPALLLLGCFAYIFWPQRVVTHAVEKTRLDYLRERKDVIYDNLRDLNFEFKAGKYPEEDFVRQRDQLETEAATVIAEMETLGA